MIYLVCRRAVTSARLANASAIGSMRSIVANSSVYRESEIFQRILVVDDDEALLRLVEDKLDQAGYEVFTALSGQKALEIIERRGLPHLAIVDIMMPGMSGFDFCQAVHEFSDLPIIVLSALNEEETVIRGIRYFAEDYITKPFGLGELVARVERVLRRMGDFAFALEPVITVDERLRVDFVHRQVITDDHPVHLTPTETNLLYILMRNGDRVTTTEFLLHRLWPLDEASTDTLRVHMRRLREKIEMDPSHPWYIVTERGLGYRFQRHD